MHYKYETEFTNNMVKFINYYHEIGKERVTYFFAMELRRKTNELTFKVLQDVALFTFSVHRKEYVFNLHNSSHRKAITNLKNVFIGSLNSYVYNDNNFTLELKRYKSGINVKVSPLNMYGFDLRNICDVVIVDNIVQFLEKILNET